MRAKEFIVDEKDLQWTDIDGALEEKLSFFEEYSQCDVPLNESNDTNAVDYFFNLPADEPRKNTKAIIALMRLSFNKLFVCQDIAEYEIAAVKKDHLVIKLNDGYYAEFPSREIREKMIMHTFVFYTTEKFNQFRTAVKLKFNKDLPYVDYTKDSDKQ